MNIAVLDPQVRRMLDQAAVVPAWNTLPIAAARAMFLDAAQSCAGDIAPLASVRDLSIPGGPAGPIRARLYVPQKSTGPRATLLYFHGGGFVLGSLDSHDALCRRLSIASGVQVLSAEYRLAPEHKFPAALEDALAVGRWLLDHGDAIDADPARLAIGGDSAGANLATTACRLLRAPFRHQALLYPMTDLRLAQPSVDMFGEGYRLTREILQWLIHSYVRTADEVTDPRVSPLLASDLSNLPPAIVLTAGFDPLRDEGQAYADALTQAGVSCDHVCFDDMIHGFCSMPGATDRAQAALTLVGEKLAAALGGPNA